MVKRQRRMATLWEVPDALWERIEPLVLKDEPLKATGRKRVDRRRVLDGIIFRMRTGCQWNHIPRVYGSDRTIHRYFQHWCQVGLFEKIWALLVEECDDLKGVQWEWQAADTAMGKARFGGRHWTQPHGPSEKRHETQCLDGCRWGSLGAGSCSCQCPRYQTAERDFGSHRCGTTETDATSSATFVPGQSVR